MLAVVSGSECAAGQARRAHAIQHGFMRWAFLLQIAADTPCDWHVCGTGTAAAFSFTSSSMRIARINHVSSRPRRGAPAAFMAMLWPAEDRKSTRLNSSHVASSYAAFCLRKKKESDA